MNNEQIIETILSSAKEQGAEYPEIAHSSDGEVIIVDSSSGRTWRVELREF